MKFLQSLMISLYAVAAQSTDSKSNCHPGVEFVEETAFIRGRPVFRHKEVQVEICDD